MSSSRLLDFFILEATDYIDRLDTLLSGAHDEQPDAASVTAQARLLRGSATMARQLPIADLASALERIGRALRDDILVWNHELHSALVAAVDDLKILIRAVRSWGAGDDRRTESRISELVSLYPQATKSHPTPPATLRNSSFVASESAQLATALDNLVAHPSAAEALAVAVHRLSSLRGVAAINDTPPLAQVLTALDDILRPLHFRNATPETPHLAVLNAGVHLLRRFSQEIAIGGILDSGSAVVQDFNAAVGGLARHETSDQDTVIPIARLNFEDGQPQIVTATRPPQTSAAQRFRLEVAGPCELLRHQVALARSAGNEMARNHAAAEMRVSLRALRSAADGFADAEVVAFIDAIEPGLSSRTLMMIDELARTVGNETLDLHAVHGRLHELLDSRGDSLPGPATTYAFSHVVPPVTRDIAEPFSAAPVTQGPLKVPTPGWGQSPLDPRPSAFEPASPNALQPLAAPSLPPVSAASPLSAVSPAPAAPPLSAASPASVPWSAPSAPPVPAAPPTPMAGPGLSAMLTAGIAGLSGLEEQPLSAPAQIAEDIVVPIQQLFYRGRDAISRALEIRDGIRARSGAPQAEELDELFELLDLAVTE